MEECDGGQSQEPQNNSQGFISHEGTGHVYLAIFQSYFKFCTPICLLFSPFLVGVSIEAIPHLCVGLNVGCGREVQIAGPFILRFSDRNELCWRNGVYLSMEYTFLGTLHTLFPLPRVVFPYFPTWLTPSHSLRFNSNISSSMKPPQFHQLKLVARLLSFYSTYHGLNFCLPHWPMNSKMAGTFHHFCCLQKLIAN